MNRTLKARTWEEGKKNSECVRDSPTTQRRLSSHANSNMTLALNKSTHKGEETELTTGGNDLLQGRTDLLAVERIKFVESTVRNF